METVLREAQRLRRHRRVRKEVVGTGERPRLAVHRSHLNLFAQIIDDMAGRTLVSGSTLEPGFRKAFPQGGNLETARILGEQVAKAALAAGIKTVVFDRGGYPYHGRIKALADGARAKGLQF